MIRLRRHGAEEPVLAYLRVLRGEYRREKRRSVWFTVYAIALVGGGWGVPPLVAAARVGRARTGDHGALAEHVLAGLPLIAPTVAVLALLLIARGAVWRGPVLADLPTLSWLLPTPTAREPLLLPRLLASTLVTAAGGLVLGGASGFLLYAAGVDSWAAVTAAGAWAGLVTALTGSAVGVAVERHHRWVDRYGARAFGAAWAAAVLPVAASAVWTVRGVPGWLGSLFLWSGPWGWAVQPLVAAARTGAAGAGASAGASGTGASAGVGGPDVGAPWWGVAAALSVCCVLAALWFARRETPRVPLAALRLRATVASRFTASVFTLDLRQARSTVRALRERGSRPRLRLPMPRRRWLLVPWRDATGLLRAPARPLWAVLWTAAAVGLAVLAPALGERAQIVAAVGATVAGYLAAAQLTEPARVESDDIRRSSSLPFTAEALALWHALVPGLLLLLAMAAGGAVCALGGWWRPGLAVLVACAPAFVAAALVSAYRGSVPPHMYIGVETPVANTGALKMVAWYARGPLAALVLTAPVLAGVTRAGTYGPVALAWPVAVAVAGLWWVRRTARSLYGG